MNYKNILCEYRGKTAILTINRPEVLNALNFDTLMELFNFLQNISNDDSISALILTGSGKKAFVAGADISYMKNLDPLGARRFAKLGHAVMKAIEDMTQPVIAAVNGFALGGGCELALACDIRYGSANAKFAQPEVNLGIIPGFGGTQRLTRIVGRGLASEMLFTGKMIDGLEAHRVGLINQISPQDVLLDKCIELADSIHNSQATKLCKEAVRNGLELDLDRACRYESDLFSLCFSTPYPREAMSDFLTEKSAN